MGKDLEEMEEVELDAVTITDEEGVERDYAIVSTFFLGACDYVALCPILEDGILDESTLLFYRCEGNDDDLELEEIESEEELDEVIRTYEELISEDELEQAHKRWVI